MKKNFLLFLLLLLFFQLKLLANIKSQQEQTPELFYIKNEKHNFLFKDFRYDRTELGVILWRLIGKTAWVFEKSNQVELNTGILEFYQQSSGGSTAERQQSAAQKKNLLKSSNKTEIKFNNCLFNRQNNQLKLNNDIIMTIYNDTPLYLYTNELFFDGNNIVENKVNNTFRYDIYTVFSQGLNFNTNNNNLRLLNNVHIADKFGNNLFANNGFIDISKNYIRLNELKKGNYNNYNVFADYCELRNNQIILVGNVKIFNGQFALNADTIIYDTVKKQVSILSNFKIDSDTFLYTGSNIIINLKNQSGFSKNIGELTLKNPNIKMLFGEFFFDTPLLTLEKNIKINNDTYMLTTNELKIKINNFQTIDKIYSDTICDFVENTMFRKIFTCGFFVEFANNNSPIRLKLLDKVKIQNYEHILEAQSGIIDFADNIIKTAKFQKNVKYNFNDYKLESDILNADFNNGNLQSIKIDSGIAVVESDTYQITSNNLKIDFLTSNKMNFQNSDFYCELLNNFTIKNKINNSFINSNRGNFTYLNNKIDNLKFSGAINGLILNN